VDLEGGRVSKLTTPPSKLPREKKQANPLSALDINGIEGSISQGNFAPDGFIESYVELKGLPRIRSHSIDLISRLAFIERRPTIPLFRKTNVAVRSRIQIPRGGGALLLNDMGNGKVTAVMISPTVQ
jgi:hypothetical protein